MAVDGGLDLTVPLGRHDGGGASGLQVGEDEVGVVTFVGEQDARRRPWLAHDGAVAFGVRDLSAAQRDRDRQAERVVVGLDPTCSRGGDACGIVAVGRRGDTAWVLADRSMRGLSPQKWAERAMETARLFGARTIVGEVNQGGDMVEAVLKAAGCGADGENIGFTAVRASRGKAARAEPVAALYEQGRVRHTGAFAALEEELMELGAEEEGEAAGSGEGHWDRADALVWAVTDLMLDGRGEGPRVRAL